MATWDWNVLFWQQAGDLIRQAERIQRNFLQTAAGVQYRAAHGRGRSWEPPVNIVDSDDAVWVMSALSGVNSDHVQVRLEGNELVIAGDRPLPDCCNDGELKVWELPLGRFERHLTLFAGRKTLTVGKVTLQNGLLIIELRKNA